MPESPRTGLFAVLYVAGRLESHVESRLSEVGLSLPKLAALCQLTEAGQSLPLGQLADRLACVKSNVTQLVDRLEADGLVSREADSNDKRSRLAVITHAGREAFRRGDDIRRRAEEELFKALTSAEAGALHRLLAKLEP